MTWYLMVHNVNSIWCDVRATLDTWSMLVHVRGFLSLCKKKNKTQETLSSNAAKSLHFCFTEVLTVEVAKSLTWYKISIGELLFLKSLNTTADNCPRNRTRTIAQHTQYRTGRVTNAKKTKNATHSSLIPEAEISRKSKSWTQTRRENGKTNTNSDTICDVFVWISLAQYKLRTAMLTNKNMHVVKMAGTFSSLKWKILSAKTIPPNIADDKGKCFDMDNIFSFLNTLYFCSMLSEW